MASSSGVAFGVLADAQTRQHRRRLAIGRVLLVGLLGALLGYGAAGGGGRGPRAPAPVTEGGATVASGLTLPLPPGRASETFAVSAPADRAYDVTLVAPAGSAVVVSMNIAAGAGWTIATRDATSCRMAAGLTLCLLHFAAGGNPGGIWKAVVRKASVPAARARITIVFMPRPSAYQPAGHLERR